MLSFSLSSTKFWFFPIKKQVDEFISYIYYVAYFRLKYDKKIYNLKV